MIQHRGQFSMIVHPNTGFEYEDHGIWAAWIGEAQPLDMSIFSPGEQTEDFGHWRGDSGNPTCMAEATVCGDMRPQYNATTVVLCCPELACACGNDDDQLCRCMSSV